MSRIVEKYYTVQQLALLLEFSAKTIRAWIAEGKFGRDVLNVGGNDARVPASGVKAWEEQHRIFVREDLEPIAARSEGELRRKAGNAPAGNGAFFPQNRVEAPPPKRLD